MFTKLEYDNLELFVLIFYSSEGFVKAFGCVKHVLSEDGCDVCLEAKIMCVLGLPTNLILTPIHFLCSVN